MFAYVLKSQWRLTFEIFSRGEFMYILNFERTNGRSERSAEGVRSSLASPELGAS